MRRSRLRVPSKVVRVTLRALGGHTLRRLDDVSERAVAALGLSMADEQEAAVGKMVLHRVDLCDGIGFHVCGF